MVRLLSERGSFQAPQRQLAAEEQRVARTVAAKSWGSEINPGQFARYIFRSVLNATQETEQYTRLYIQKQPSRHHLYLFFFSKTWALYSPSRLCLVNSCAYTTAAVWVMMEVLSPSVMSL